jgi:hypothetical protein
MEKIEVVFVEVGRQTVSVPLPSATVPVPVSLAYYHQTLLYTNSDDQTFMASALPENRQGASSPFLDVSGAATGATANYGKLLCWTGSTQDTSQFSLSEINDGLLAPSNPRVTVAAGSDLFFQWAFIVQAFEEMNDAGFDYSPLRAGRVCRSATAIVS